MLFIVSITEASETSLASKLYRSLQPVNGLPISSNLSTTASTFVLLMFVHDVCISHDFAHVEIQIQIHE